MKKTTLLTGIAALAMSFGFTACAHLSQAEIDEAVNAGNRDNYSNNRSENRAGNQHMHDMEIDCKNFVTNKFNLAMYAVSVNAGYGSDGRYTIPVRIHSDDIQETGNCKIVNGRTVDFIRN